MRTSPIVAIPKGGCYDMGEGNVVVWVRGDSRQ